MRKNEGLGKEEELNVGRERIKIRNEGIIKIVWKEKKEEERMIIRNEVDDLGNIEGKFEENVYEKIIVERKEDKEKGMKKWKKMWKKGIIKKEVF